MVRHNGPAYLDHHQESHVNDFTSSLLENGYITMEVRLSETICLVPANMGQSSLACSLLILLTIFAHLYISPFTKVEESFTIQAVHDILNYGVLDISEYDHLQYPGVVPRSFVGPLILSAISVLPLKVLRIFNSSFSPSNLDTQFLVRSIIGLTNGLGLIYLKNQAQKLLDRRAQESHFKKHDGNEADKPKNSHIGLFFCIFCVSQFHLMYYSSRPLPNFVIVLPLVNFALGLVLNGKKPHFAISLLAFCSIVFRLELIGLTAGLALSLLSTRRISLSKTVMFGSLGAMLGATVSLYVDSYFWQNWTLPELDAFLFNVVEGESVKWGTMPFHAYLTNSLPMIFIPPTVLLLNFVGFRVAPKELKIIAQAAYFHIFILAFQPHKEWRFIVYAVPVITLVASCGASHIFTAQKGSFVLKLIIAASPLLSLAVSVAFALVSSLNYPGGHALSQFNQYVISNNIKDATVHMDVPACMTGITLFGELDEEFNISYDKTETLSAQRMAWPSFDYLITAIADPQHFASPGGNSWELIFSTKAFSGINIPFFQQLVKNEMENKFQLAREILHQRSLYPLTSAVEGNITSDVLFTFRRKSSSSDN
ncbi:LAME_0H15258g1_1 [Lachancea meyersii CBS 8951]|uniref:Mannosyltransferase n=1 Tax=Lachancea meyersii CBS 8951 TaxID=1266667 RepID=A0A1G4KHR1_9SACH|nr:LAME_0H15258g1_1 [Lachancea meyersii CBS 8951]